MAWHVDLEKIFLMFYNMFSVQFQYKNNKKENFLKDNKVDLDLRRRF